MHRIRGAYLSLHTVYITFPISVLFLSSPSSSRLVFNSRYYAWGLSTSSGLQQPDKRAASHCLLLLLSAALLLQDCDFLFCCISSRRLVKLEVKRVGGEATVPPSSSSKAEALFRTERSLA